MTNPLLTLAAQLRSYWRGPISLKDPELSKLFFSGGTTSAGVPVNEWTAMNYAAVWQAVTLISAHVASLPLVLYKRNGQAKERYTEHALYHVLHDEPNPEMSAMTFRETLQGHLLLWGNGYAEIERTQVGGQVKYLWPLTPDRVYPFREPQSGPLRYRVTNADGSDTIMDARSILHIPGLGWDGQQGYSVIAKARESMGLGLAAERFDASFLGNGSTFGGVLSTELNITDPKQLDDIQERINKRHQGPENAGKFLALPFGFKYSKLGVDPVDAQLLETRKFQVEEIARWFNLPPHKLKHLERSTNNNIEHQGIEYYTDTLLPWLVRWEQEINRKLIAPLERRIQFVEHIAEGVLRGDAESRGNLYQKLFAVGAITSNQIAAKENLPLGGPEGDRRFVPVNMQPLDVLTTPPLDGDGGSRYLDRPARIEIGILSPEIVERDRASSELREREARERQARESAARSAKLDRLQRELDEEEQRLKTAQDARLTEWRRRRRALDTIATRWPSTARQLRESGWVDRTSPSEEDDHVRVLVNGADRAQAAHRARLAWLDRATREVEEP